MQKPTELPCPLTLSIVVPVYRSAAILPELVEQIHAEMVKEGLADTFELLLVSDASPDNSWQVIRTLAESHPFIRGISLRRNFGQHNAIMAGLNHVRGDFVVLMDDDLQHPPHAIGDMLRALQEGYDVCYTHYLNRQHAVWKKLGSQFNDWVATHLLGKPAGLYLSSFKGLRREIVAEVIHYDGPYAYVDGLILDVTRSITTIDIEHGARHEGEGNYNLSRSIGAVDENGDQFFGAAAAPRDLCRIRAGGTQSIDDFVYVIAEKWLHPELPAGWTSLIATILFIGGIQTLCIGMVGEYLGRTYLKLNHKPQFVVGSKTWNADEK